jgi:Zn finger protein HypA/HybF involved in hydrogenase expression
MKEKMKRMKTSIVWTMPREEFLKIVEEANGSCKVVLRGMGLKEAGGNYRTLRARFEQEGLDWDLMIKNANVKRLKEVNNGRKFKAEDVFVENSNYFRGGIKRRIIEERLLEEKCSKCGQGSEWDGEKLVLVLDHINGIKNDNRIENLRLLCPNCNSQTETFSGRNATHKRKKECVCKICGKKIGAYSKTCQGCRGRAHRRVERPELEVVRREVELSGWEATGRK